MEKNISLELSEEELVALKHLFLKLNDKNWFHNMPDRDFLYGVSEQISRKFLVYLNN
jgi:hypothetical protein